MILLIKEMLSYFTNQKPDTILGTKIDKRKVNYTTLIKGDA
jgi:hypothetical protein